MTDFHSALSNLIRRASYLIVIRKCIAGSQTHDRGFYMGKKDLPRSRLKVNLQNPDIGHF